MHPHEGRRRANRMCFGVVVGVEQFGRLTQPLETSRRSLDPMLAATTLSLYRQDRFVLLPLQGSVAGWYFLPTDLHHRFLSHANDIPVLA